MQEVYYIVFLVMTRRANVMIVGRRIGSHGPTVDMYRPAAHFPLAHFVFMEMGSAFVALSLE